MGASQRETIVRYFEDLELGEILTFGGSVVDLDEAAEFARRFDPARIPPPGRGYIHRGPEISLFHAAALSWKLLSDLAASADIADAEFERPFDLEWQVWRVSAGDVLRVEVELVELLPPSAHQREHGWARSKVTLITTGPAGFGSWADDDQELVDDVALTYFAHLKAKRREAVSIYHGIG